jgi:proteasome lid subunit RPN8/RPN11
MTRPAVHLADGLRSRIVDHCLSELPNEGCGLLAMDGDVVVEVYPTANDDRSPYRYTIPPGELYAALVDAETKGWRLGGVFHSHPRTSAEPSTTDIERAVEPDWLYLIVGLGNGTVIRGWMIESSGPGEVVLI